MSSGQPGAVEEVVISAKIAHIYLEQKMTLAKLLKHKNSPVNAWRKTTRIANTSFRQLAFPLSSCMSVLGCGFNSSTQHELCLLREIVRFWQIIVDSHPVDFFGVHHVSFRNELFWFVGSMGATDPDDWVDLEYEKANKLDDDPKSN